MKLLNSKKLKLRNKAFVWTGKVRNVVGLNVLSVGCQDLKNNGGSIGAVGKSQKQFETDEKMKVATQDTTKTSLLTLSGSKSSIVVTAMKKQKTKDIMLWMTKTHFSIFNRLNFYFQIIYSIIPVLYSCGFLYCTWSMLTIPGIAKIKYPLGK